jgi:hypothetical protein
MARKKKEMEVSMTPDGHKLVSGNVTMTTAVDMKVSLSAYDSAKYGEGKYGAEQPRGMETPEEQKAQPYFKAGMEVELQKFGKPKRGQLLLGEDADIRGGAISYGLDLTKPQARALHAVQKLLDATGYKGNLRGKDYSSTEFQWRGYIPALSFTPSEFYQAYGLQPAGDGRYHGAQTQQALEALKSLMQPIYKVKYDREAGFKDGKKRIRAVRWTGSLITSMGQDFQDVTEEELELEDAGQELPDRRNTKIAITPSILLLDGIDTGWYLLKPANFFTEIQALYPGKKYPDEVYLFLNWLLTKNKYSFGVNRDALAEILRMDSLIRNRRRAEIDKRITEALEVAKRLEYLLSYEIQPTGLIDMKLNPERIKRIKSRMARGQKPEEETE